MQWTSLEAHEELRDSGKDMDQERRVVAYVVALEADPDEEPRTTRMIAQELGLDMSSSATRVVSELTQKGLLQYGPARENPDTGKKARTVRPTQASKPWLRGDYEAPDLDEVRGPQAVRREIVNAAVSLRVTDGDVIWADEETKQAYDRLMDRVDELREKDARRKDWEP